MRFCLRLFQMLVLLCGLTHPALMAAQGTPVGIRPGDVVRFRIKSDGVRVGGRVSLTNADTLWLESVGPRPRAAFARSDVMGLEQRMGGPSGAVNGLVLGSSLGAGLGVAWGVMMCSKVCENGAGALPVVTGVALGVGGALVGAVIGALTAPAEWSVAVWPEETGIIMAFRISIGRRS